MNTVCTSLLREARLFIHTPATVHLGIIRLLWRLLVKRRRPMIAGLNLKWG